MNIGRESTGNRKHFEFEAKFENLSDTKKGFKAETVQGKIDVKKLVDCPFNV
jgi:hypothetical protein